ncbi:type IV pilus twitching motility protein PilT [Proteiniclasticum sediminis]|nr:type IV pilus twitching motility protein PilT [Proteiniclasticum sediminis]
MSRMELQIIFQEAVKRSASDIHLAPAMPPLVRIDGQMTRLTEETLTSNELQGMLRALLSAEESQLLQERGQADFGFEDQGIRYRANVYRVGESLGAAFRILGESIPRGKDLGLPEAVELWAQLKQGLVLVTGPTGSGKTTTLAAVIQEINETRKGHILTLEDPVEYRHESLQSLVTQREIPRDSKEFSEALRAALRQDPDVILVGEMRDLETIQTAITAAETGHLVLSTLHTTGAVSTVDRMVDVFPPHQQEQIRLQLSMVLEGIVTQKLLPKREGSGRIAAFEVLTATPAVRSLIRDGKTHQLYSQMQMGASAKMRTMDQDLLRLYRLNRIDRKTLKEFAMDPEGVEKQLLQGEKEGWR